MSQSQFENQKGDAYPIPIPAPDRGTERNERMQSRIVKCKECGEKFDTETGGTYGYQDGEFTCPSCWEATERAFNEPIVCPGLIEHDYYA